MAHYYSKKQDSPLRITRISAMLRGNELDFDTAGGVFSVGKIDRGSDLLINRSEIGEEDSVLDLGCGYGAVGLAIAKAFPKAKITMTDINERAVMLSRRNRKINKIENAEVVRGDGFKKIKEKFDVILINPPQSAGKKLCIDLMKQSKDFLKKGGSLQAVMRHKIGGKDVSEKVKETFGNCETVKIKSGYRIYKFKN